MSPPKSKLLACPLCQGTKFKNRVTTYPMRTFDGRQINIGRVAVYECGNCHHLIPTKAGEQKISRCMATITHVLFDR